MHTHATQSKHKIEQSNLDYKRRAVAAQTARSRCKVLSTQYLYYFSQGYTKGTLHCVGIITKLYFVIFCGN